MLLLVGLGNPEDKYVDNRHNIGFMVIDALCEALELRAANSKCEGELFKGNAHGTDILALKPTTYMNNSGIAVGQVMQFYKLKPEQVIVFHDELDLDLGKLRIKMAGGAGGHNGIKSIDGQVGKNYRRVRMGIGKPEHKGQVSSYVLSDFEGDEWDYVKAMVDGIVKNIKPLLDNNNAKVMNDVALDIQAVHKKLNPETETTEQI